MRLLLLFLSSAKRTPYLFPLHFSLISFQLQSSIVPGSTSKE